MSKDVFARFLAFGITATILIQAFFNISVVLALLPTKGVTLPFVSYGGTSLFITLASIGMLLSRTREIDCPHAGHDCRGRHRRPRHSCSCHRRRAQICL